MASTEQDTLEPLLRPNPNRFVMFPVQYRDIWLMYKKHEASSGPLRNSTSPRT